MVWQVLIAQNLIGQVESRFAGRDFGVFANIIQRLVFWLVSIGVLIAFITLLIGGIRFVTAGGNERSVAQAKGLVVSAIFGIAILFSVLLILTLVDGLFGTNFVRGGLQIIVP